VKREFDGSVHDDQHGNDHYHRLRQQRKLKRVPEPEHDAEHLRRELVPAHHGVESTPWWWQWWLVVGGW